jgi:phosphoglucosamine mutase
MKKIFGTDGVRCVANGEFMNPDFVNRLTFAIYKVLLLQYRGTSEKVKVIIAKDTRKSGYMIENAIASCLMAMGVQPILVGPIPTPSIPFLIKLRKAHLGLMISASHNPHQDNGIKIFNKDGFKVTDVLEKEIENIVTNQDEYKFDNFVQFAASPENIGVLGRIHNTSEQYVDFLIEKLKKDHLDCDLSGMKIVIDCANGAGYKTANFLFKKLNANVTLINNKPDGININKDCGAMHPEVIAKNVKEMKADLGISLDGDADRIIVCDESGEIIDNDKIMAAIAIYYKKQNRLKNDTLVTTILSNNSLEILLETHDIKLKRTAVGDKYISEAMRQYNFNFGGEKSGHIIFGDYSKSGDGVLAGAIIALIMRELNNKPSEFFQNIQLFPQVMRNINYIKNEAIEKTIFQNINFQRQISLLEKILGHGGRILVRKSGTEKKIRLMAEGEDLTKVNLVLDNVSSLLNDFLV